MELGAVLLCELNKKEKEKYEMKKKKTSADIWRIKKENKGSIYNGKKYQGEFNRTVKGGD